MTTWKEIKLATLQKMFAANGNEIPTDTSTKDYLAAMPNAANEALQRLSTAGKFIKKSYNIAHNPVKNYLSEGSHIHSMEGGELEFKVCGIHSIYFAHVGQIRCQIFVNEDPIYDDELLDGEGYSPVKYQVESNDEDEVRLVLSSDYPYAVKDIGMYKAKFRTVDEIQPFTEKLRYNLAELIPDFYELSNQDIYYEGDSDVTRYLRTSDYFQEGGKVLVLDRDVKGNFRVYYNAYPQKITEDTDDDTVLAIDDEVAVLMPLYMASQLYKDDDMGVATTYRNEFEVAFEALRNANNGPSSEKFTSKGGWY